MLTVTIVERNEPHEPLDVDALSEADAQAIVRSCLRTLNRVINGTGSIFDPLWSERAKNCCRTANIRTLGELSETTRCLPRAGRLTVGEYIRELEARSLPVPEWMRRIVVKKEV